ncbi:MAG: YopX family protein [Spirochaetaceae bacterium]|nr:YopX family protein [Spirochaetaceae bacterium]
MREIKFRGKRKDNGEWIFGGAVCNTSGEVFIEAIDFYHTMVHPETVGQYTGLTDKNGVKIFEGDILRRSFTDSFKKTHSTKCLITFERGCFMINRTENPPVLMYRWHFCEDYEMFTKGNGYFEVVGNIHDNPELLKREGGAE